MKRIILFVFGLCFLSLVSAQVTDDKFKLLEGDTYSINMFKDWLPPTGAKKYGEPLRKKNKYETTTFTRVRPKSKDGCGSTLTITEIKGCRNYLEIFQKDSISWASTNLIAKVKYEFVNESRVKRMAVLIYKADRHPETNKLSVLQQVNWYLQGEQNTYQIHFTSCAMLLELLPQVKMIVASLEEKQNK